MNYTLVGAFVLLLGALAIAIVVWLVAGGSLHEKFDRYRAVEDESVAGLSVNAPVKYNGVEVGKVQEVHLDARDPGRVNLVLAIARGTPIKVDTVAVLKTQGLTGIAYVELSGGGPDSVPLLPTRENPSPFIKTKPSLSARLENVLTTVLAKLDSTSENLNALFGAENRLALTSALTDIAAVSRTIAARRHEIDTGIAGASRTFEHGARAAAELGPLIERIGRSAAAIESMGNAAGIASTSAAATAGAIGTDIKRFTATTLPELERLLGELQVLAGSLRRFSDQAERNPNGLLFGRHPVPDGPGESGFERRLQ